MLFKIREQLAEYEISVYEFPREDDEAESSDISLPFAVVGFNTVIEDQNGKKFRGREYPWGCVNIEDPVSKTLIWKLQDLIEKYFRHTVTSPC